MGISEERLAEMEERSGKALGGAASTHDLYLSCQDAPSLIALVRRLQSANALRDHIIKATGNEQAALALEALRRLEDG